MARPTSRRPTAATEGPPSSDRRRSYGYSQVAPLVGDYSGRGAVEVADQLQRLLLNGGQLAANVIENRNRKAHEQGRADAAVNKIDAAKIAANEAYEAGAESFKIEAELRAAEPELREYLRNHWNRAEQGLKGLHEISSQFYAEKFGKYEADKPHLAPGLRQLWGQMAGGIADEIAAEQIEADAAQDVAAITEVVNHRITTGEWNAEHYVEIDAKLSGMFGKRQASAMLARILITRAISEGRPDLLDDVNFPTKLPNGAGTAKLDPSAQYEIANARKAAEAQKAHNENVARQKADAEREAASVKTEVDITLATLDGQNITRSVAEGLASGLLSPEKARTLLRFAEDFQKAPDEGEGETDVLALAEDELAIINGDMNADQVRENYRAGKYGYGKSAQKAVGRLLVMTGKPRKADGSDESVNRDVVRRAVAPEKDLATGKEPIDAIRRQANAVLEYERLVDSGVPPEQAADAVIEKYTKRPSAQPQAKPKAAPRSPKAATVDRVIRGEVPARESGLTPQELRRMRDSGEITVEQYDAFLSRS